MSIADDLAKLEDFASRLETGDYSTFDLLSRSDQRELVMIARRLAVSSYAYDASASQAQLAKVSAGKREVVDHAQALQLQCDLLRRAGDLLAESSTDDFALRVWAEALQSL